MNVSSPRIVSLLPGATEMIAAIGASSLLVGISHECDWPSSVQHLPRVTTTPIDASQTSGDIDRAVRGAVESGSGVIGVDAELLRSLAPTVIVTQVLCDVCAVADGEAMRLAQVMDPAPRVIALSGRTLEGVWQDIRDLGRAIGREKEADRLVDSLTVEVGALRESSRHTTPMRAVAIEWLDPPFLAGHWVPEMIAAAGGIDIGAAPGSHSSRTTWPEVLQLDPDICLIILCGFDEARARRELELITDPAVVAWLADRVVLVLDGNAFTSRPGPRLVEGIASMAKAIRLSR